MHSSYVVGQLEEDNLRFRAWLGGAGRIMRRNTSTWRRRLLWFGEFSQGVILIWNRKPQKRVCWKTLYIFSRLPTWMTWWNTWRSKQNNRRPDIFLSAFAHDATSRRGGVVWCKNDCINSRGRFTTLVLLVGRLAGLGLGLGLVVVGCRWCRKFQAAFENCLEMRQNSQSLSRLPQNRSWKPRSGDSSPVNWLVLRRKWGNDPKKWSRDVKGINECFQK